MKVDAADYNAFARGLTQHFVSRALGLDDASAQIVGLQPSDQVLAGFLTPGGGSVSSPEGLEDDGDLRQDSAYEQTAIGMEWRSESTLLDSSQSLDISVSFNVFVRRLPSYDQVKQSLTWRRRRPMKDAASSAEYAEPTAVWTREQFGPFHARVVGSQLRATPLKIELAAEVQGAWGRVDRTRLYPGRTIHTLNRQDVESREAYESWVHFVSSNRDGSQPIAWEPVLDLRVMRSPNEPAQRRIALRLINQTPRPSKVATSFVDACLYAVDLNVTMPKALHRPSWFRELPDSFRFDRKMVGVGINSQVECEATDDQISLRANPVPITETPRLVPRSVVRAPPRFDTLSKDPCPTLELLRQDMLRYHQDEWLRKVESLVGSERREAEVARDGFLEEIARFQRGIELLSDPQYPIVQRAFGLMNEAMRAVAKGYSEWRLFQIVFIVSQIPALAGREYPELRSAEDDSVEILWFAAGGGKTEGFLGLILWQAFFDRLRKKTVGLSALVRFPLRLLGFQQFGRIGRALAAAELIRVREGLGGARFSLGFFVGSQVTPNSVNDEQHARYQRNGVPSELQLSAKCPFCASPVALRYNTALRLIEHWCESAACAGGQVRLPIYVVDQDIYRFLPTVVVSTVDKLAQLGQNQKFGNLLGRVTAVCPHHGATFDGIDKQRCEAAAETAQTKGPNKCGDDTILCGPFHDPGPALLVQDEMHLLAEDLGAFDAHYETAAAQISRSLGLDPWKIIGATATIEDYAEHAWQLYLKKARRFPAPGPASDDSFYYKRDNDLVGRIFVGVLGVGRKHTPIVSRGLTLLYWELQAFRELTRSNPALACRRYSLRDLDRQSLEWLTFLYELPLTYVLTRKGSDQVAEAIESRVKKELDEVAPNHGELLIRTFNSGVDVSEMMTAMATIENDDPSGNPADRVRGLVATSIIGHGVDVDRFNVMVFAGFTRLVAEYIQASARVGRTYPGISILAVTPQSERDRSIFDRFGKFHEYLDRLVDPSAVNRWSTPALQRTMPGILAGYLMSVAAAEIGQTLWSVEAVQDVLGRPGADALNGDETVRWIEAAYGASNAPSPHYKEILRTTAQNMRARVVNASLPRGGRPTGLNTHLGAMRSLRDVDEPAEIRVGQPTHVAALRGLIRG